MQGLLVWKNTLLVQERKMPKISSKILANIRANAKSNAKVKYFFFIFFVRLVAQKKLPT